MARPQVTLDDMLNEDTAVPVPDALHPAPALITRTSPPSPRAKLVKPAKPPNRGSVPSAELVNLSFKVPAPFRKRFKGAAVEADLSQVDLLAEAFELWSKSRKN